MLEHLVRSSAQFMQHSTLSELQMSMLQPHMSALDPYYLAIRIALGVPTFLLAVYNVFVLDFYFGFYFLSDWGFLLTGVVELLFMLC